ncbi:hypothetical protein [Paramagnetospirillum magneticum]|uniref:Uncharacterized protein n=1 Tax=Paramagnetospirillum magneticum (strain ATCC 700264 / AMB-1) TaxID=342108 RepID=Q2W617_PARM1|nr:hypothetical protein [Paramagnetospirillum magneticum]BAE50708.1 hypothetical protein amb1904 [Paramagnetospirillum magneticum AMB-1]
MFAYATRSPVSAAPPAVSAAPPAVSAAPGATAMGSYRYSGASVIQRVAVKKKTRKSAAKVNKHRAGRWFSEYDPFTVHATQAGATAYHKTFAGKGLPKRYSRVPTFYTYTHTKPGNQLTRAKQGPHTVAHRVTMAALIKAKAKADAQALFNSQVPAPGTLKTLIAAEAPPTGYSTQIAARIARLEADYAADYAYVQIELLKALPDMIGVRDAINRLMNMHPFATSGWKSTGSASGGKLAGKGEGKPNPTFKDLVDPPSTAFRGAADYNAFIGDRQTLFNQVKTFL